MKTIKLFFAAIAILLAGVGVFANTSVDPIFYYGSADQAAADCDETLDAIVCGGASGQCRMFIDEVDDFRYISKKETSVSACEPVSKAE
jgi:hypothetical protein